MSPRASRAGPYGDAINHELIPYIEQQFRGIAKGWARGTFGGSTGGWEALATQMFYPDDYNGAWAACPDAVDFRMYEVINIYDEKNAFYNNGDWKKTPHADGRDYYDRLQAVTEEDVHWELVLGTHGRSGDQWNIWQAVYSPVGEDGYPKYIWDPMTGVIDHKVAEYWRDHYDLSHILRRDWAKLGPKLQGKIHVYVGSADTYFLNDAVYYLEDFLKTTSYGGEVKYGDRAEHCWNGDPTLPNYLSRLYYNTMYVPKMLERMAKTAPPGADLKSWRY